MARVRCAGHPGSPDRLTARERELLDLIEEGLTNRQIAGRIHLAEATVKKYGPAASAEVVYEKPPRDLFLFKRESPQLSIPYHW